MNLMCTYSVLVFLSSTFRVCNLKILISELAKVFQVFGFCKVFFVQDVLLFVILILLLVISCRKLCPSTLCCLHPLWQQELPIVSVMLWLCSRWITRSCFARECDKIVFSVNNLQSCKSCTDCLAFSVLVGAVCRFSSGHSSSVLKRYC
jgi:hypothetical protein